MKMYTFQGVKKVAGYAPASIANWSVAVAQNYDELLTTLGRTIFVIQ